MVQLSCYKVIMIFQSATVYEGIKQDCNCKKHHAKESASEHQVLPPNSARKRRRRYSVILMQSHERTKHLSAGAEEQGLRVVSVCRTPKGGTGPRRQPWNPREGSVRRAPAVTRGPLGREKSHSSSVSSPKSALSRALVYAVSGTALALLVSAFAVATATAFAALRGRPCRL